MRPTLRGSDRFAGVLVGLTLALARTELAHAGRYDLELLNLCEPHTSDPGRLNGQVLECNWVHRGTTGLIDEVVIPAQAEEQFRSLVSELGAVMAPRLSVPAQTLGFAGFQVAAELGVTGIHPGAAYWDGVQGVSPQNRAVVRPDAWLTTVGASVRKGLWLGLPAIEVGAGVVNLLESRLLSWQGYAKVALHEGFHRWPIPAVALRGSVAYLTGTDQVRVTTTSVDLIASQGFGVKGTFRVEPYAAWSVLSIRARSGVLDVTPSCDAFRVGAAGNGEPLGDYCADSQRGTDNDKRANVSFSEQSPIRRQRLSAGAKVKFAAVFLSAQYDLFPAGRSRDGRKANGARDDSGQQQGFAMSAGFDF
jgi:hypothetical protein